jgi:hypothetical protein
MDHSSGKRNRFRRPAQSADQGSSSSPPKSAGAPRRSTDDSGAGEGRSETQDLRSKPSQYKASRAFLEANRRPQIPWGKPHPKTNMPDEDQVQARCEAILETICPTRAREDRRDVVRDLLMQLLHQERLVLISVRLGWSLEKLETIVLERQFTDELVAAVWPFVAELA